MSNINPRDSIDPAQSFLNFYSVVEQIRQRENGIFQEGVRIGEEQATLQSYQRLQQHFNQEIQKYYDYGYRQGVAVGYSKGSQDGYQQGLQAGYQQGYAQGQKAGLEQVNTQDNRKVLQFVLLAVASALIMLFVGIAVSVPPDKSRVTPLDPPSQSNPS